MIKSTFASLSKAYCNERSQLSAPGLAAVKRLVRAGGQMNLDDGLRLDADTEVDALQSSDVREGFAAFKERRTPAFA